MLIWLWTFVLLTLSTWRFICATMTSPMPSGRWNIHWTSRVSTARSTTVSCTLIQQKRLERLQVHQTSSLSPSAAQNWHSGCGTVSAQLKQLTLCYLSSSTKSHSQRQPKFPHLYKPTETLTTQVYWTQTGTVSHLLRTNITLMIICSMEKLEGTLRVLSVQARWHFMRFLFSREIFIRSALWAWKNLTGCIVQPKRKTMVVILLWIPGRWRYNSPTIQKRSDNWDDSPLAYNADVYIIRRSWIVHCAASLKAHRRATVRSSPIFSPCRMLSEKHWRRNRTRFHLKEYGALHLVKPYWLFPINIASL